MNRSLALLGGYCVSIPRVYNLTKFTSSIEGWKKEWKRARLNAGMRSSQCVCSREDDNLQLRHIQLISFPGFLSLGNWEWGAHRESCKCLGSVCVCNRKEASWPDRKLDNLAMEPLFENTFHCGRSRLWETWSSRSLLHCWGCQLLELYEGVFFFFINNPFEPKPKTICMRGKSPNKWSCLAFPHIWKMTRKKRRKEGRWKDIVRVSTAETFPRSRDFGEVLVVFQPQEPVSKWSSR